MSEMNTYIYVHVHVSLILFDIYIDYSMSVKKLSSFYLRVFGIKKYFFFLIVYNILSIIRYKLDKLLIHAGILPGISTQPTGASHAPSLP